MGQIAASIGSGIVGSVIGLVGQNAQNQYNSSMVEAANSYNTLMADTQYQRTVADMRDAGLNPMMMYTGGGGTDTSPTMNVVQAAGGGYSSAAQIASATGSQVATMVQNQGLVAANTAKAQYDAQTSQTQSDIANQEYNQALTKTEIQQATEDAMVHQIQAQSDSAVNSAASSKAISDANIAEAQARQLVAPEQAQADVEGARASSARNYWNYQFATPDAFLERGENAVGAFTGARQMYNIFNPTNRYNPNTTGTFDLGTGEVH